MATLSLMLRLMQLQTTGSYLVHHIRTMWAPVFASNRGSKLVCTTRKQV